MAQVWTGTCEGTGLLVTSVAVGRVVVAGSSTIAMVVVTGSTVERVSVTGIGGQRVRLALTATNSLRK